jgi:hypothetical protein
MVVRGLTLLELFVIVAVEFPEIFNRDPTPDEARAFVDLMKRGVFSEATCIECGVKHPRAFVTSLGRDIIRYDRLAREGTIA